MGNVRSAALCVFLGTCLITGALAQDATSDAYAARDICVGVAAKFLHAPPGTPFSYNAGKFKIEGTVGEQATIFDDSVPIATIPNFNYKDYTTCVDSTLKGIREKQKKTEIKKTLALFNTTLELNNVLYVGECLESTAKVGVYIGDTSRSSKGGGQNIVPEEYYEKFLVALDISLANRLNGIIDNDVNFALEDDIRYFRYVQGRFVPYFETRSIQNNNAYITDNQMTNISHTLI
jgi:hypothetical protein